MFWNVPENRNVLYPDVLSELYIEDIDNLVEESPPLEFRLFNPTNIDLSDYELVITLKTDTLTSETIRMYDLDDDMYTTIIVTKTILQSAELGSKILVEGRLINKTTLEEIRVGGVWVWEVVYKN